MGEAVWFKVHKIAMSTTVVLGLLGLVPVLVDRGVDPIRRMEYHPMVGLATLAIALAQPAVAYLRPGKVGGRRARPPGAPLTPLAPLAPGMVPQPALPSPLVDRARKEELILQKQVRPPLTLQTPDPRQLTPSI